MKMYNLSLVLFLLLLLTGCAKNHQDAVAPTKPLLDINVDKPFEEYTPEEQKAFKEAHAVFAKVLVSKDTGYFINAASGAEIGLTERAFDTFKEIIMCLNMCIRKWGMVRDAKGDYIFPKKTVINN